SGSADDDVVKIEYNAQGYISKAIEDYEEGGANSDYTRYTYDANNRLIKSEEVEDGNVDDYDTYEYTDGLVTAIKEHESDGTIESTRTFKYDGSKRLIEATEEIDGDDYKQTFEYDNKGNVTKAETLYGSALSSRRIYENYDDKSTFYSSIKGLVEPTAMTNKNNPGKVTEYYFTDANGDGVVDTQPYETYMTAYTYKYNGEGFPTEVTEEEDDGELETTTFTYDC
ncbi:hypothetical protein ACFS7Z_27240, partial [Pontibacter toksunensis]